MAALLATKPEYNDKVSCAVFMAPFIHMNKTKPPISTSVVFFETLSPILENTEFAGNIPNQDSFAALACSLKGTFCYQFFQCLLGSSNYQTDPVSQM